jgi:hypothetical protein
MAPELLYWERAWERGRAREKEGALGFLPAAAGYLKTTEGGGTHLGAANDARSSTELLAGTEVEDDSWEMGWAKVGFGWASAGLRIAQEGERKGKPLFSIKPFLFCIFKTFCKCS